METKTLSQKEQLELLYGVSFKEENLITCKDINGNDFFMLGTKVDSIHALEGGYIFTPDGKVITVYDSQDHDSVFSFYINNYLGKPNSTDNWNSYNCSRILNELGHIVYFGAKLGYARAVDGNGVERDNYLQDKNISKMANGLGVLTFPKNKQITNEQRICSLTLLFSNLKEAKNSYRKCLDISYGNMETDTVYSSEELSNLLEPDFTHSFTNSEYEVSEISKMIDNMKQIQEVRLENINREYSVFQDETNKPLMEELKKKYDAVTESNVPAKEKFKQYQALIEIALSTQSEAVYKYMLGEHQILEQNMRKVQRKINCYSMWKLYLTQSLLHQDDYKKKL